MNTPEFLPVAGDLSALAKLLEVISDPKLHQARLAEIKEATDAHNKAFAAATVKESALNKREAELSKKEAQAVANGIARERNWTEREQIAAADQKRAKQMLEAAADENRKLQQRKDDIVRREQALDLAVSHLSKARPAA